MPRTAPQTSAPTARVEDLTRVVLRPLASPLPLGFLTLAIGSCLVTALQLDWIAVSQSAQVGLVLIVFVAPVEIVTAIIAYLIRDVVMATALGLLAGAWVSTGLLLREGPPGAKSSVLGVLAIAVAVAMLVPAISAAWAKPTAAVVTAIAAARFAVTGIYELGAGRGWETAAGTIGVVLLVTAGYGSLALSLEDALHRAVLPISRRGGSRQAMSGELVEQLITLPTEAGVRQES